VLVDVEDKVDDGLYDFQGVPIMMLYSAKIPARLVIFCRIPFWRSRQCIKGI
jgi:hypothetical protein